MLTALVLLTLVLLLIWYWRKNYFFWKDQNVPQLPTWPILGSYMPGKKPLQELEQELYKTYGRVYGRYDGSLEVLSVGEPHLLKHILIKDFNLFPNRRDVRFNDDVFDNTLFALEGDNWKRVRSIVTRNLTTAKLKRMLPLMDDCCDILIDTILSTTQDSHEVNLQKVFSTFTIDVIGRCAFGVSIGSLGSADDPFVEKAKRLLDCKLGFRTVLTMLCPSVMKSLRISLLNPETTSFYRNVILDVMEERKKNKKVRDDFLQLLLDVQNDIQDQNNNNVPDTIGEKHPKSEIFTVADEISLETDNKNLTEKGLSLDELVAQCVTFFMAGYDATTTLLTNALYHLATNHRHQERVLQEMKEAVQKQGGVVNYETLSELKYLDAVLNECLRLCPSMVRNERRVENDYILPETHIRLKRGMVISIPVYAMHRDPEWYPEPDLFRPDRFLDTDSSRPSLVHIPFGAGPRVCVGFRFVMMQVKLCLTRILLRFQATPATTTPKHLSLTEVRNVLKINDIDILLKKRTH